MWGFTLIELLVVLIVIGILLGLAVPRYMASVERSRINTYCANVRTWMSALETYKLENGTFPTLTEANALLNDRQYFSVKPKNPWTGDVLQLQATVATPAEQPKGFVGYEVSTDGTDYTVQTNPECDL